MHGRMYLSMRAKRPYMLNDPVTLLSASVFEENVALRDAYMQVFLPLSRAPWKAYRYANINAVSRSPPWSQSPPNFYFFEPSDATTHAEIRQAFTISTLS